MLNYLLILSMLVAVSNCQRKPNFVVILTDDQDVVLGGMEPMKNVKRFIGNEGVTFTNSFTTSPICCPSRASLLTGLYVHNHVTKDNSVGGGCNGPHWKAHEKNTFATALNTAGWNTFYAGKYLNEYGTKATGGPEHVPPGWSEWHGLVGNSVYYNYTISNNGVPTMSADLYLTDIIRDLGVTFIENQTESKPFLLVLAPPAPHQPFTPAPRHNDTFKNVTAPRNPNFNIAVDDKHWLLSMPPSPLPQSMLPELDRVFRSRWQTLLAVDEMVADVVGTLDNKGLLEDTYLIYTSDNGYHIGQFSQVYDKRQPYETDIRVPLLIKGPLFNKNVESATPVLNIDIAPTILNLAGVSPTKPMDGHPIDISMDTTKERTMLIEYVGEGRSDSVDLKCPWKYDGHNLAECYPQYDCKCQDSRNNTYACIRQVAKRVNMKYCLFSDNEGFAEAYDLTNDPYELNNIVNELLPALKYKFNRLLKEMLSCKNATNCDNPLGAYYF